MTIRGLRKEMVFRATTCSRLNAQTRCELTTLAAEAWLNLRLQLIALAVVLSVVLLAIIGRELELINVRLDPITLVCI